MNLYSGKIVLCEKFIAELRTQDPARYILLKNLIHLATDCLNVSGSFISVLNENLQHRIAVHNISFHKYSLQEYLPRFITEQSDTFYITDISNDARFSDYLKTPGEPEIRFFACTPLRTSEGVIFGTLGVCDIHPRRFSQREIKVIEQISYLVMEFFQTWNARDFIDDSSGIPNSQSLVADLQILGVKTNDSKLRLVIIECINIHKIFEIARTVGMLQAQALLREVCTLFRLRLSLSFGERLYTIAPGCYAVLSNEEDKNLDAASVLSRLQDIRLKIEHNIYADLIPCAGETCFNPSIIPAYEGMRRGVSALHEAISSGSSLQIFNEKTDARRNTEFQLMNELAAALHGASGLYMVYQPKFCLKTGTLTGLEALIRWCHPVRGDVSPDTFLPAITRTHLHSELADWVINDVTVQLVKWQAAGCAVPVSINLSESDITRDGFAKKFYEGIILSGLTPQLFEIECLETEKIIENEYAVTALTMLRERGVRIALDDFGSGYNNVNYLRRMPFDIIKLDRELISDIVTDRRSQIIVTNTINMLKSLEYTVIAEGVEDLGTAKILLEAGCDIAQGYYYSRPLPAGEITKVLYAKFIL